MRESPYFLAVDTGASEDGVDGQFFTVSILLARRDPETGSRQVWGGASWPAILDWASDLLIGIGRRSSGNELTWRVDVARVLAKRDVWPRWCYSPEQCTEVVNQLITYARSNEAGAIYPVSIWLVPQHSPLLDDGIREFRIIRFDEELWEKLLTAGVSRISIEDGAFTLQGAWRNRQTVLRWLREVIDESPRLKSTTEWR